MCDVRLGNELVQEALHVGLANPGNAAIGPRHPAQRIRKGHQRGRDPAMVGIVEEDINLVNEGATPAATGGVQLSFGSTDPTVEVEDHAATVSTGWITVDAAG